MTFIPLRIPCAPSYILSSLEEETRNSLFSVGLRLLHFSVAVHDGDAAHCTAEVEPFAHNEDLADHDADELAELAQSSIT